jgi:hypothetical protein
MMVFKVALRKSTRIRKPAARDSRLAPFKQTPVAHERADHRGGNLPYAIQQVIHGDDHEIGVWPTRKYDRPAEQPAYIAAADTFRVGRERGDNGQRGKHHETEPVAWHPLSDHWARIEAQSRGLLNDIDVKRAAGVYEAPRIVVNVANLPELPQLQWLLDGGSSKRRRIGLQNAFVSRLLPQLPRHSLGPIASGQHASVVTKHD